MTTTKIHFWAEITGKVYIPSIARGNMIRSTIYRLLHPLISMSVTHHKNSDRVPYTYLFFLWTLVTLGRHLNLLIALATYMGRRVRGIREDSPICDGYFVTHLARSYLLLSRDITRSMVFYDARSMILQLLESMRVLERGEDSILWIRPDDVADEEGVSEPEHESRGWHIPALRGA